MELRDTPEPADGSNLSPTPPSPIQHGALLRACAAVLARAPSFESLAHSITRDVHPRTLLEELTRLGLARVDDRDGRVHLLHTAFVPRADRDRMLAFLGANVGDHLAAAVDNVQADGN